jgi:hypothetical protein
VFSIDKPYRAIVAGLAWAANFLAAALMQYCGNNL